MRSDTNDNDSHQVTQNQATASHLTNSTSNNIHSHTQTNIPTYFTSNNPNQPTPQPTQPTQDSRTLAIPATGDDWKTTETGNVRFFFQNIQGLNFANNGNEILDTCTFLQEHQTSCWGFAETNKNWQQPETRARFNTPWLIMC